jgi:hypothetical protein
VLGLALRMVRYSLAMLWAIFVSWLFVKIGLAPQTSCPRHPRCLGLISHDARWNRPDRCSCGEAG